MPKRIVIEILAALVLMSMLTLAANTQSVGARTQTSQRADAQMITMFSDDFESYSVGTFPSPTWKLWSNGAGSSYQVITTSTYVSPIKALQLWASSSLSAIAAKPIDFPYNRSSTIGYEVSVRVSKVGGLDADSVVLGFAKRLDGFIRVWGTVTFWDFNGTIRAYDNDMAVNLQTYLPNTWYTIRVILDRPTNTYFVWINDVLTGTFAEVNNSYEAEAFILWSHWQAPVKCFFDDAKLLALPMQSLTLFINPPFVQRGAQVIFCGSLFPAISTTVYLFYQVKGTVPWVLATTVTTNSSGQYSWTAIVPLTAPLTTVYFIAYWPGNASYSPVLSNHGFPTPLTVTT